MKGKIDTYVLWPLSQKSPKLNSRPVYCSRLYGIWSYKFWTIRQWKWLSHCTARELQITPVTNSSHPQRTSKEKETQICHRFVQTIGLLTWHQDNSRGPTKFWRKKSWGGVWTVDLWKTSRTLSPLLHRVLVIIFLFFDTKNFWVLVICGQFSQSSWKIWEKYLGWSLKNSKSLEFIDASLRVQQMIITSGGLKWAPPPGPGR